MNKYIKSIIKQLSKVLNDKTYIRLFWRIKFKHIIDLDDPKSFNEKLQWLKLYDRRPEYTAMVDKYAVKKYVADKIGKQYIIPTLGVWDRFDDIDFDSLPEQFVLKCTHDSGSIVICKDKKSFDKVAAGKRLTKHLKNNYYYARREWPYKNVKPRIIAKEYMCDTHTSELCDYKFFCFNGIPRFLYISKGLNNHETAKISYVTLEWIKENFFREDYPVFDELPDKPVTFNLMIEFAELFSKDIPFLRVDFYEINNQLFFSEFTFYPGSGFTILKPEETDYEIGRMLNLPKEKRE